MRSVMLMNLPQRTIYLCFDENLGKKFLQIHKFSETCVPWQHIMEIFGIAPSLSILILQFFLFINRK